MVENESNRVISEDRTESRPAFINSEQLEKVLRFGKLAGVNFLKLVFFSTAVLFVFSGYKLIFQYRLFTLISHFVVAGSFHFSVMPGIVWVWLLVCVLSLASLMAFFNHRV